MSPFTFAVLTVSDRCAAGQASDRSGPVIRQLLSAKEWRPAAYEIVPDDRERIQETIRRWADQEAVDLILTTGGTGPHPRDVTPEATRPLLQREIPGIAEAMRWKGLKKTPHAMLSRGCAGVRGRTLIVNLPGSPQAVREGLEVILPALPHAIRKIQGDPTDCAPT